MIIIGASGLRLQTMGLTLSISHTWCPQSETEINWLQKTQLWKIAESMVLICFGRWSFSSQTDWQSAKPSVLPRRRSRYIFSHFRRFLKACFLTKPHNLSGLSWIWNTFAIQFIKHKRHWIQGPLRSLFPMLSSKIWTKMYPIWSVLQSYKWAQNEQCGCST